MRYPPFSQMFRFLMFSTILLLFAGCTVRESSTEAVAQPIQTIPDDGNSVRVAVLAIRSAEAANTQYGPFLTRKINLNWSKAAPSTLHSTTRWLPYSCVASTTHSF